LHFQGSGYAITLWFKRAAFHSKEEDCETHQDTGQAHPRAEPLSNSSSFPEQALKSSCLRQQLRAHHLDESACANGEKDHSQERTEVEERRHLGAGSL